AGAVARLRTAAGPLQSAAASLRPAAARPLWRATPATAGPIWRAAHLGAALPARPLWRAAHLGAALPARPLRAADVGPALRAADGRPASRIRPARPAVSADLRHPDADLGAALRPARLRAEHRLHRRPRLSARGAAEEEARPDDHTAGDRPCRGALRRGRRGRLLRLPRLRRQGPG